jgi:hypothetical protein
MVKKRKPARKPTKSNRKPGKPSKPARKPSKPGGAKARAKPKQKATPAKRAREGERELHYTDLRKVTLAAALKRLR